MFQVFYVSIFGFSGKVRLKEPKLPLLLLFLSQDLPQ
jgi:hypothetical protein